MSTTSIKEPIQSVQHPTSSSKSGYPNRVSEKMREIACAFCRGKGLNDKAARKCVEEVADAISVGTYNWARNVGFRYLKDLNDAYNLLNFFSENLEDRLLHSEIVFDDALRVVFVESGIEKEMTFDEFFEVTLAEFNSTDWHMMKCSLVLYGVYSQKEPRSFKVMVIPGTLSYQIKPST